jgi:Co/Zn/Cd efflux system component
MAVHSTQSDPNHDHDGHHGDHQHAHDHDHIHSHAADPWWSRICHLHAHDHDLADDPSLEGSERGIWALKVSLLSLLATAFFQVLIVLISGSVGLLANTIHNFADAGTAIRLWIAFALNRRQAPKGYTYRWGKAEDMAGVLVVLVITVSAIVVF